MLRNRKTGPSEEYEGPGDKKALRCGKGSTAVWGGKCDSVGGRPNSVRGQAQECDGVGCQRAGWGHIREQARTVWGSEGRQYAADVCCPWRRLERRNVRIVHVDISHWRSWHASFQGDI